MNNLILLTMKDLGLPVIIMGIVALVLGVLITVVSKKFEIPVDVRVNDLTNILPGANCGGCGYSGCSGYAAALASGEEKVTTKCSVGGPEVAEEVASYLGLSGGSFEAKLAVVHCQGTNEQTSKRYDYNGTPTCASANMVSGGPGSCTFGCLGFADCQRVCEYDAITMRNGIATIDPDKCTACGKCVTECPKKIIHLIPKHEKAHVNRCSNPNPALFVKKACKIGCIGCTLCVKKCPVEAISMKDSLAVIDQSKCIRCGACKAVCPAKSITSGLVF